MFAAWIDARERQEEETKAKSWAEVMQRCKELADFGRSWEEETKKAFAATRQLLCERALMVFQEF